MSRRRSKRRTIYVVQYLGYNGGFARYRQPLWKCVVVGANKEERFGGSWMSEGTGTIEKAYATAAAKSWSGFTGWPIVDLGRDEAYDEEVR